jgi:acid phosphatase
MEENATYVKAHAAMPYLVSLGVRYGYATHYTAITHPSLPNYLAIDAGSTFGITDDKLPSAHPLNVSSVFDQAIAAGHTGKTYAETMPTNCGPVNSGAYAVRHSPWPYFTPTPSHTNCMAHDVPATGFLADARANALPTAGMLTPDENGDAHDGTLGQADAWLQARLPTVIASSDFTSGRLAVVVVFDEGAGTSQTVMSVVLDANLHGKVVTTALTHYSLSRFYSQTIGVTPLLKAATAPDMRAAFGL